jgi:hypothetical protein
VAKTKKPLPIQRLKEVLRYEPATGKFYRVGRSDQRTRSDKPAGALNTSGHRQIKIDGGFWLAHRIAWAFHYGEDPGDREVDHINGNRDDNRIENLRLATLEQQGGNRKVHRSNSSGHPGVHWSKKEGKWLAYIGGATGRRRLGLFKSKQEAVKVRRRAAEERWGEYAAHVCRVENLPE